MISLNSYFVRNCFPKAPESPLPISYYELSITNYGFLVIDFLFPISNYELSITNYGFLVIDFQFPISYSHSTVKKSISIFTDIFPFFTEFSAFPA
jgi:hypothetical protein